MSKKINKLALLGICTALALILAYIELLLQPLFPAIPGIKMGLPNVIIIFLLYRRDALSAFSVSLLRIILSSILFGNPVTFLYSLTGGILSLTVMTVIRRINLMSTVGVSVAGGVTHNIGQVLIASLLLETSEIGYYLVVLTLAGTIAGIFIGLCGSILIKKLPK